MSYTPDRPATCPPFGDDAMGLFLNPFAFPHETGKSPLMPEDSGDETSDADASSISPTYSHQTSPAGEFAAAIPMDIKERGTPVVAEETVSTSPHGLDHRHILTTRELERRIAYQIKLLRALQGTEAVGSRRTPSGTSTPQTTETFPAAQRPAEVTPQDRRGTEVAPQPEPYFNFQHYDNSMGTADY